MFVPHLTRSGAIYRGEAGPEVLGEELPETSAPDGSAHYSVVAMNGDAEGGQSSLSAGARLVPNLGIGTFLPVIVIIAIAALLLFFLVAKMRKDM